MPDAFSFGITGSGRGSRGEGALSADLTGLAAALLGTRETVATALRVALADEAEDLMNHAKAITPVKHGHLVNSGHVLPVEDHEGTISTGVGFGNDARAYAVPVHEIPEPPAKSVGGRSAHHEHGQWHFLSEPAAQAAEGLSTRLASAVQGALS